MPGSAPFRCSPSPFAPSSPSSRTPIDVTPERRESLAKSIFTDFLADGNFGEALAAAQDLAVPGFMRRLAEIGLARAYDARTEEEWRAVTESPARFLEFWTLKEAYLKALGLGLPGGLRSLDCTGLAPAGGGWSTSPAHPGWRFQNFHPEPGFVAALAVEGAADSIELRRWDPTTGEAGEAG